MENRFSTERNLVFRVIDFLDNSRTVISDSLDGDLVEFIVACRILELLGDPVGIPSLVNLLKKYGGNRSCSDRFILKAATDVLISMGEEAVRPLTELLKSENSETRKFTAYALGKIGDRRAFPALTEVVNSPKEPKLVREVAGRAMLQLNPEKATEIIDPDGLTPTENPLTSFSRFEIELDLEVINKYYSSPEDIGPPSKYRRRQVCTTTLMKCLAFILMREENSRVT